MASGLLWVSVAPPLAAEAGPPWKRSLLVHHSAQQVGTNQIWATAQDSRGFHYAIGNSRLVRYDGVAWRPVVGMSSVRHLAIGEDDRIFLASALDLGVVEGVGDKFVSWLDHLPESQRDFQRFRTLQAHDGGVVVASESYVHRLRGDGSAETLFEAGEQDIREIFLWRNRVYVETVGPELLVLEPGSEPEPVASSTDRPLSLQAILDHPTDETAAWVLTDQSGTWLLREGALEPYGLPADDWLEDKRVTAATRCSGGRTLVTTRRGGAAVLDREGRIEEIFDRQRQDSINDSAFHGLEDPQGNLWLATDDGVVQVPWSPAHRVVEPSQVEGTLHRAIRHRRRLYVATRTALYRQRRADDRPAGSDLERVPGLEVGTWDFRPTAEGLLVANVEGVFRLDEEGSETRVEKLCPSLTIGLFASRSNSDRLFATSGDGLRILDRVEGRWTCGATIPGVEDYVHQMVEADGEILLKTSSLQILGLTLGEPDVAESRVRQYAAPEEDFNLLVVEGRVLLSNESLGIFSYRGPGEEGSFPFEPDDFLSELRSPGVTSQMLVQFEPDRDRIWLQTASVFEVAERPGPAAPFVRRRVASDRIPYWSSVHHDPEGDLHWITHRTGAYLWDPSSRRIEPPSGTHLARVSTLRGREGLPFGTLRSEAPRLPFASNGLRFEFAAPVFDQLAPSEFQYQLEGFDDGWSDWTSETTKEFTNLWEGRYRFRVRSRDRWDLVGAEATFDFIVEPPPYRTPWAYGLYLLGLCGVLAWALRAHRTKLARERAINDRLRAVDRLKDEFLANTSHELRTPLYGITGLAESLLDGARGELPDAARDDLALVAASGQRLTMLVDDILDFSKLRHHGVELHRRPVDLRALVGVVMALVGALAVAKQLRLVNDVAGDLPAVDGDENRLQQILFNLLGNAVKFTDEGEVRVGASVLDGRIEVAVHDTGIGIPEEKLDQIFEAFAQADGGAEREFGGTGLGLTVTRQLLDLHGSALRVESVVGEGSVFRFDLPIATGAGSTTTPATGVEQPAGPISPRVGPEAPGAGVTAGSGAEEPVSSTDDVVGDEPIRADGSAGHVLVVDDEPVNRRVLVNQLVAANYRVREAASGSEALLRIDSEVPDLVLLDVMMPRMSGFEVCVALRERYGLDELPVLFLTAKRQPSDLVMGLTAGANDYLTKPIPKSTLLARVQTHLALRAVHQELSQLVDERTAQVEERSRLLSERERLIGELEARNTELARFNYTVSHDLKNPLTTIKNFIGMARHDAARGQQERLEQDFDRLEGAADRLHRLLDDLYALSQIGGGDQPHRPIDFGRVVALAREDLAELTSQLGAVVEVAQDLPEVWGDRRQLVELVRQLLRNALTFVDPSRSPRIEIGVRGSSDEPVFQVADNGLGIEPQYHEKIFGLFECLDPDTGGTGVGLALARRVVEVHGGRLWVESEGEGEGSTFCFTVAPRPEISG